MVCNHKENSNNNCSDRLEDLIRDFTNCVPVTVSGDFAPNGILLIGDDVSSIVAGSIENLSNLQFVVTFIFQDGTTLDNTVLAKDSISFVFKNLSEVQVSGLAAGEVANAVFKYHITYSTSL